MLKQRIITGIILVSLFLWAVFFWSSQAFIGFVVVLCAIGAHEWSSLGGIQQPVLRVVYAAGCGALVFWMSSNVAQDGMVSGLNAALSLAWVAVLAWLLKLSRTSVPNHHQVWSLFFAPLVMCGVGMGMVWLRDASLTGPWLLIYVLAIAWAADVGAYFIGKKFGRRKLSPVLSPGKSIEGALGGLGCASLLAVLCSVALGLGAFDSLLFILITLVSAVFSIGGDLFESALKRSAGVKDSGWILPGHGGVLDRVDSPLASVPVFVALSTFLPL